MKSQVRCNVSYASVGLLLLLAAITLSYLASFWVIVGVWVFLLWQRIEYMENYFEALDILDDEMYGKHIQHMKRLIVANMVLDIIKGGVLLWAIYFIERTPLTYLGFVPDRSNPLDPLVMIVTLGHLCVLWDNIRDIHWLFVTQRGLTLKVKEPFLVRSFKRLFSFIKRNCSVG